MAPLMATHHSVMTDQRCRDSGQIDSTRVQTYRHTYMYAPGSGSEATGRITLVTGDTTSVHYTW